MTLSKDHVLTKVEGCSDNRGRVASVQVTYGLWKNGKVTEQVSLSPFGGSGKDCKSLNISEGDSIKKVKIVYSASSVN